MAHDYKHDLLVGGPLLCLGEHILEEAGAGDGLGELEVARAGVGGQRQQDDPFALMAEERLHAVRTHVGSHGEGVDAEIVEEGAGVERRGVADVATLRVGDDQLIGIFLADVGHGLCEHLPTLGSESLVEGGVGLVGHAVGGSGVDDGLIEGEHCLGLAEAAVGDACGEFQRVAVESDTEKRALAGDVGDKFLLFHIFLGFMGRRRQAG